MKSFKQDIKLFSVRAKIRARTNCQIWLWYPILFKRGKKTHFRRGGKGIIGMRECGQAYWIHNHVKYLKIAS